MNNTRFFVGDWQVTPSSNTLQRGKTQKIIEPKAMDVLLLLCQQQGEVLSADEIIDSCWSSYDVGDNPVHKAINQLRRALGDKASSPTYIETIRKRGYRVIAPIDLVDELDEKTSVLQWRGGSPYVGLSAFSAQQHDVFFGRDRQVDTLLNLSEQAIKQARGLILILGPSGCGKSSLIHAGVLPKLAHKQNANGLAVIDSVSFNFKETRGEQLWLDFASHIIDWQLGEELIFSDISAQTLSERLQSSPEALVDRIRTMLDAYAEYQHITSPRLGLVLDHLEVLLDSPDFEQTTRHRFLEMIQMLSDAKCILTFGICRNDFYPQIVQYPTLMRDKIHGAHFDLTEPTATDLIKMIQLPAQKAGLKWETESKTLARLDETIANDISIHGDALPLLQYTLSELYEKKQGELLTFEAYQTLGGIEGALGNRAETVFLSLGEEAQEALNHILGLLISHSADGSNTTSKIAYWSSLTSNYQHRLVQAMVDSRLFISDINHDQPSFRLAHEALLRSWSRIEQWIEKHRHSLTVKAKLLIQTNAWIEQRKDTAYLLPKGKPLDDALELVNVTNIELTVHELDLIKRSQRRVKNLQWWRSATVALLMILTLTSVMAMFSSQQAYSLAEQKRQDAENLLGYMVGDFADKLRSVRRMDLLDGISSKALEYFTEQESAVRPWLLPQPSDSLEMDLQQVLTIQAIAEVDYSRGDEQGANKGFNHAIALLDALAIRYPNSPGIVKALGINHFWVGQIAYDTLEYEQALASFRSYQSFAEQLVELKPGDHDALLELSYAHNTLGTLSLENQEYEQARDYFHLSLLSKQSLLSHAPQDTDLVVDIADTHSWLASVNLHLNAIEQTTQHYQHSRSLLLSIDDTEQLNASIIENLLLLHLQEMEFLYHTKHALDYKSYLTSQRQLSQSLLSQDSQNQYWQQLAIEVEAQTVKTLSKYNTDDISGIDLLDDKLISHDDYIPKASLDFIIAAQRLRRFDLSERSLQQLKTWLDDKKASGTYVDTYYQEWLVLQWGDFMLTNQTSEANKVCQEAIAFLSSSSKKSISPALVKQQVQIENCINDEFDKTHYLSSI